MDRYLCIHGHFYQPPRENPWLEAIELQESAYPYHDWNDRITDECYAANGKSRILDGRGSIVQIVNNYAHMSYNFGPTVLSWMQEKRPEVYRSIIDADKESAERFGGHGSAVAQGYGHIILPLSHPRDKRTQVRWGIRDFESRFGRKPEGMWCPETAVNTETLEALAEQEIKYTILAPRQAARFRKIGADAWTEANGGIDPTRAYLCRLPSGRSINLFFYDGPVSQAVAFERLLDSGEKFANRLLGGFSDDRDWPQLMHIATDGESYGHHHRHGDMALAYALHHIESNNLAKVTNYGQYLEMFPPDHEAQIVEDSSWSCVHGVERWRSNCGCNSGRPGWHQNWRGPLRAALDWLRDSVAPLYEREGGALFRDAWRARDDYIEVVLDRSAENVDAFLGRHAKAPLDQSSQVKALRLLEMQRHAMLMYTSCGWFFDELSGIETVQVAQYAARVMQLAQQTCGVDLEPRFMDMMAETPSNTPERPNGKRIYEDFVKPAVVDLLKVGAHHAIASLFEPADQAAQIYAYTAITEDDHSAGVGRAKLRVGRVTLTSRITRAAERLTFGVLYLGDHMLTGGVRPFQGDEPYQRLVESAKSAFDRAEYTEVMRAIHEAFPDATYTLRSLFKDEQRRVLDRVLETTLREVEAGYRQVYANHAPLLKFLGSMHAPAPPALRLAAEFVLNGTIRRALRADPPNLDDLRSGIREAQQQGVELDRALIAYEFQKTFERLSDTLERSPTDAELITRLTELTTVANELPFEVSLWDVQNTYYDLLQRLLRAPDAPEDGADENWREAFLALGRNLHVKVD